MSKYRHPILSGTSEVLPTANGTLYTDAMNADDATFCQVYIEFFSDAIGAIPATPTAGTIDVQASPMGNNYIKSSNVTTTVDATKCSTPDSTYTPPYFEGRIAKGRITFAGITGASYARVTFWRY